MYRVNMTRYRKGNLNIWFNFSHHKVLELSYIMCYKDSKRKCSEADKINNEKIIIIVERRIVSSELWLSLLVIYSGTTSRSSVFFIISSIFQGCHPYAESLGNYVCILFVRSTRYKAEKKHDMPTGKRKIFHNFPSSRVEFRKRECSVQISEGVFMSLSPFREVVFLANFVGFLLMVYYLGQLYMNNINKHIKTVQHIIWKKIALEMIWIQRNRDHDWKNLKLSPKRDV
jgi:hypothetical protein